MRFHLLASGSKGNCFVLIGNDTKIVIDCGSSKRHLLKSFESVNVDYHTVDGLLLTHTHSDHISQLRMFNSTKIYSPFAVDGYLWQQVIPFSSFNIKEFKINPIPLSHDSGLTLGYIIEDKMEKIVYITDTGYLKQDYYPLIANADYYVMESNHDIKMLMDSRRPYPLKQRIISDNGHLDNETSSDILAQVIGDRTKEIVLAHISEEANRPEIALKTIKNKITNDKVKIQTAGQFSILTGGR
ncbi:MAG: MBL fold metallo-hydrolase [Erysipelotrichaceae bacterium]|nr:MBL fold metallo-hydrolase [Erysipelotrichaceae bacterium]